MGNINLKLGVIVFSFFVVVLLIGWLPQEKQTSKDDFPVLKGPYLGQKPPGLTPEIFAPGIISTDEDEACSGFSLDGKLFIFRRIFSKESDVILISQRKNDAWMPLYKAPFDSKYYDGDFTFAPDGKTLYFSSKRPLKESGQSTKDINIWVVKRTSSGWSQPHPLEYPINTDYSEGYPSITNEGTLYFFSSRDTGFGKSDIYRSRLINGKYPKVENLGKIINTEYGEFDPFIAADESYLIFCSSRPGGYGEADLYITFRKNNNEWTKPANMGDKINSSMPEWMPYIAPDGKHFFFTSTKAGSRDIYWIDARIIQQFKPKNLK